jgi:hypothetical protein
MNLQSALPVEDMVKSGILANHKQKSWPKKLISFITRIVFFLDVAFVSLVYKRRFRDRMVATHSTQLHMQFLSMTTKAGVFDSSTRIGALDTTIGQ